MSFKFAYKVIPNVVPIRTQTLDRPPSFNTNDECKRLREELAEKNELIRQLREQIRGLVNTTDDGMFTIYKCLQLSRQERAMINVLLTSDNVTNEMLYKVTMAGGRLEEGCDRNHINIVQHRLNKKLLPHGIRIQSIFGVGKYLTYEDKEKLKNLALTGEST